MRPPRTWPQLYGRRDFPAPIPSIAAAQVIALSTRSRPKSPDVFIVQGRTTDYPFNFAGQAVSPRATGQLSDSSRRRHRATAQLPHRRWRRCLDSAATGPSARTSGQLRCDPTRRPGSSGRRSRRPAGSTRTSATLPAGLRRGRQQRQRAGRRVRRDGNPGDADAATPAAQIQLRPEACWQPHAQDGPRRRCSTPSWSRGSGPLGSVFNRDDFTDREVQDTDGDGLPEFVDAWGQPLQFYRWPIYFNSDLQRGVPVNNNFNASGGADVAARRRRMNYPYTGAFDPREQDTLDPSQQLMAPSWWSSSFNSGTSATVTYPAALNASLATWESPGARCFTGLFHTLTEPMISRRGGLSGPAGRFLWDRR